MLARILLPGLIALAIPLAARAQPIDLSTGGPVDVTASQGFEWRQNEQKVIATGDARAVRGDVTVIADRLIAYYRKKPGAPGTAAPGSAAPAAQAAETTAPKPSTGITEDETGDNEVYRLEAEGNVRIYTPTDVGVGDRAVYDIDKAVLVMTGKNMKITTPQQVMTARDTMEYWSQPHMSVGRGDAVVVTSDGRRISADVLVGFSEDPNANGGTPAPKPVSTAPPPPPVPGKPPADPIAASGKLKRVEAYGNVEIRTTADIVRGDRGLYLPDTGMSRIVGHVRITHGQNQMNGPAADLNMKTGIAHLISSPTERVTGLIIPNDPSLKSADSPGAKPDAKPDNKPAGQTH